MYDTDGMMFATAPLVPLLIFSIIFAIGSYHIAGRMGRSRALWVILTIIPVVNFFFYIYAFFAVLLYILDRLNEATNRTQRTA